MVNYSKVMASIKNFLELTNFIYLSWKRDHGDTKQVLNSASVFEVIVSNHQKHRMVND